MYAMARSWPCRRPDSISRVQAAIFSSLVPFRQVSASSAIAGVAHIHAAAAQPAITRSSENRMLTPVRPAAQSYHGSIRRATLKPFCSCAHAVEGRLPYSQLRLRNHQSREYRDQAPEQVSQLGRDADD